jgi:hypothetical protein
MVMVWSSIAPSGCGGVDPWKQRLGYKAPKDAYLVLLDRNSVVRWRYNGPFDEGAATWLSQNVRDLLKTSN